MAKSRRPRIRFWLIYLLTTFFFGFLALEVAVRLLKIARPLPGFVNVADPYLPFKPKPLSTGSSRTTEFECEYKHNSFGFRDVEHSLKKPEGVFRILALGDSMTYGEAVSFQDSYLYRLEEMLNSREGTHPRVEIIKAGISRYFPEAERLLLEHYGINFSPDLITVAFSPNDIEDTRLGLDAVKVSKSGHLVSRGSDKMAGVLSSLYAHSHVFRIVLTKYKAFRESRRPQIPWDEIYESNGFYETAWQKVESEYQKMVAIADSVNAHISFIHIPQQGPWDEKRSYPAARLSKWSSEHGAEFIDILPAMKEASRTKNLYYEKDGHCRAAGYEVVARVLFKELTERDLVP